MKSNSPQIYALCSDGMHNKFKVQVNNISFWLGKQHTHEATRENIELFVSQVPFDEKICIYTDSSAGNLHSAHIPLYTNGAVSVDAIINNNGYLLYNRLQMAKYKIDINEYI
jgi:hypothetical protein